MSGNSLKPIIYAFVFAVLLPYGVLAADNSTNSTTPTPAPSITPIELEASYYVEGGEKTEIREFTHAGEKYYMLLVDGEEAVVFDKTYSLVSNEADIKAATASYTGSLDNPFKQSNLDSLKTDVKTLTESYNYCNQVYYNFTKGIRNCFFPIAGKVWLCSIVYDVDLGAFLNLSYSITTEKRNVNEGFAAMNASIKEINDAVNDLDSNFASLSLTEMAAKLSKIGAAGSNFRGGYQKYIGAHNKFITTIEFAKDGGLNRCDISTTATSAIESAAAVGSKVPNPETVSESVIDFTRTRATFAAAAKKSAALESRLDDFDKRVDALRPRFNSVNKLEPTYLNNARQKLRTMLETVRQANDTNAVLAFDDNFKEALEVLNRTEASLEAYAQSGKAVNNATLILSEATRKYGQSDPRIAQAGEELNSIKKTFELKESDLRTGRKFEKTDFESINSNATAYNLKMAGLGRRENELDLVTIGGAALLILVLVGGFLLIKRIKEKQQGGLGGV